MTRIRTSRAPYLSDMEGKIYRNISIIVAIAENRAIGKDNKLLWHVSEDLKRFKKLTTGHTLIMGRKTFESLQKFLAGRRIIVLTRDREFNPGNAETAHSLDQAVSLTEGEQEIFIAGGAEIYALALSRGIVDTVYLTVIHQDFDGDTWFPEFPDEEWELQSREDHNAGEKNPFDFSFLRYERKA